MRVRDAVEDDVECLASLGDLPASAVPGLIHDRTVCVAENDGDVVGFVAFDAREDAVYVTQLAGPRDAEQLLLDEPKRFATAEEMPVEIMVPAEDEATCDALRAVGFEDDGPGPRFGNDTTRRFRLEP